MNVETAATYVDASTAGRLLGRGQDAAIYKHALLGRIRTKIMPGLPVMFPVEDVMKVRAEDGRGAKAEDEGPGES